MRKTLKVSAAVLATLGVSSVALAVGDAPMKLNRRQAVSAYASVRSLMTNDNLTCPTGQAPVSGLVTGGSSPAGGSQTTTITFDKGATVTISKSWSGEPAVQPSSSVKIICKLQGWS